MLQKDSVDESAVGLAPGDLARPDASDSALSLRLAELELQNEQLRRERVMLDAALAHHTHFHHLAPVGYLTLSVEGVIVAANRFAANLLGLGQPALLQQAMMARIFAEDLALYQQLWQQTLLTRETQTCELRLAALTELPKWVCLSATRVQDDMQQWVVCMVLSDVSQQRATDAALWESERFIASIADDIPGLFGYWNTDLRCVFANKGYSQWFGRTVQEMQGISLLELMGAEQFRVREPYARAALRGENQSFEGTLTTVDGQVLPLWIQYISHVIDQKVHGFFAMVTDLTTVKRDQELLRVSHAALKAISQGVMILSADGRILSVNDAFEAITGYAASEVKGRVYGLIAGALTQPSQVTQLRDALHAGESFSGHFRHYRKDGSTFWDDMTVSPVRDQLGVLTHFVGVIRDISEQKQAEDALRIAATGFESQEAMLITDANSVILRVNRAFTEITGYSAQEAIGQTPRLFKSGRHDASFYAAMWKTIRQTGSWQGEVWDRRKDGQIYPKWLTITAVKNGDGAVTHYVGAHTDITSRKAAEDLVMRMAFYDPLTTLPNRRLFQDRLSQAMAASQRNECFGAVLFLDLDNFKPLNDTHGHGMGDRLLVEAAKRLVACVREVDTVARFGGDEFVVIISELTREREAATQQVAQLAQKMGSCLAEPYQLRPPQDDANNPRVEHRCTASIGVALFVDHEANQSEVIRRADAAMYEAKLAGRNQVRFHNVSA